MASKESDCEGGDVRWCAPVKTQEDTQLTIKNMF